MYHCALLVYIRMKAVRIDPVSTRKFRGRGFGEIKPGFTRLVLNQYKQGCKNGLQFRPALYLFPILALLPFHSHYIRGQKRATEDQWVNDLGKTSPFYCWTTAKLEDRNWAFGRSAKEWRDLVILTTLSYRNRYFDLTIRLYAVFDGNWSRRRDQVYDSASVEHPPIAETHEITRNNSFQKTYILLSGHTFPRHQTNTCHRSEIYPGVLCDENGALFSRSMVGKESWEQKRMRYIRGSRRKGPKEMREEFALESQNATTTAREEKGFTCWGCCYRSEDADMYE